MVGQRSEVARAAFLSEIDRAVDAILDAPSRWPAYVDATRRYVCQTFLYTIVYFIAGESVVVAAIAHEKRRPGYWRERMR